MKGDGYLYQRGKIWWIGYNCDGKNLQESAKTTDKEVAQKLLRARVGNAAQGIVPLGMKADRVTLRDMIDALEADYSEKGNRSTRMIARVEQHLVAFFGEKTRASQITKPRIQKYVEQRRTQLVKRKGVMQPPAVATINGELRLLKRAFNVMVEAKRLGVDDVPAIKIDASKENVRKGFVNIDGFAKLVEALPEDLKDPVAFLYHSGCRVGEMRTLEWQDIDLDERTITIRAENSKNGEARTLELSEEGDELLAIIKRQVVRRTDRALVFLRNGKKKDDGTREAPSQPIGDIRKAWRNALTMAELDENLVRHDFRRSAARNFDRAGIAPRIAMRLTGHKTMSMYDRYRIVAKSELRDARALFNKHVREELQRAAERVEERVLN
jgi:integrase